MKQALVVGGTGMLAPVTPWLIAEGFAVTVIGRKPERLQALLDLAGSDSRFVTPVALDYHDSGKLHKWLEHVQLMQGPFDVVVAWIHQPKTEVLEVIDAEVLGYRHDSWRLIDLEGLGREIAPVSLSWTSACRYQRIDLGYQRTALGYRWLTDEEIVAGVKEAVLHPEWPTLSIGER
jgi:hypothetical protein